MKFTCTVDVDVPRDFAAALFVDKANHHHWQPEFRSVESVSGAPDEPGTVTRMKYQSGNQKFDLIETVRVNQLPNEFLGEYETPGTCWNTMHSKFLSLSDRTTRYEAQIEYRFDTLMLKLMALFVPRLFKKQTQRYLDNFKRYAEREFIEQDENS